MLPINLNNSIPFSLKQRKKSKMMMISKALVTVLAVSAMAMAILQDVEGGRDVALKEAKAHNPQVFNQNLGYKPKEEYNSYGYKYKDRDCYEYGKCDKPKDDYDCDGYKCKDVYCYEYGKCDKPKEDYDEYDCDGYKCKDKDCDEYGNCDKSPYREDDDDAHRYNSKSYKKPSLESKEAAGKYGVHPKYP